MFFGKVKDDDVKNNPVTMAMIATLKFKRTKEARQAGFTEKQIAFMIKYHLI